MSSIIDLCAISTRINEILNASLLESGASSAHSMSFSSLGGLIFEFTQSPAHLHASSIREKLKGVANDYFAFLLDETRTEHILHQKWYMNIQNIKDQFISKYMRFSATTHIPRDVQVLSGMHRRRPTSSEPGYVHTAQLVSGTGAGDIPLGLSISPNVVREWFNEPQSERLGDIADVAAGGSQVLVFEDSVYLVHKNAVLHVIAGNLVFAHPALEGLRMTSGRISRPRVITDFGRITGHNLHMVDQNAEIRLNSGMGSTITMGMSATTSWTFSGSTTVTLPNLPAGANGNVIIIKFSGKFSADPRLIQRLTSVSSEINHQCDIWDRWLNTPLNNTMTGLDLNIQQALEASVQGILVRSISRVSQQWADAVEPGQSIFNVPSTLAAIKLGYQNAQYGDARRPATTLLNSVCQYYLVLMMMTISYMQFYSTPN